MYWESRSMNCLTWPTDCKENIQWVGQGEGLWQLKALHIKQTNNEIDNLKIGFYLMLKQLE